MTFETELGVVAGILFYIFVIRPVMVRVFKRAKGGK